MKASMNIGLREVYVYTIEYEEDDDELHLLLQQFQCISSFAR